MERDLNAPVYVISVAAELAGVHPQTLRVYERRGLLDPARTKGGTRRYSEADLQRLQRIVELIEAGVNLEGVRRILALESEHASMAISDPEPPAPTGTRHRQRAPRRQAGHAGGRG